MQQEEMDKLELVHFWQEIDSLHTVFFALFLFNPHTAPVEVVRCLVFSSVFVNEQGKTWGVLLPVSRYCTYDFKKLVVDRAEGSNYSPAMVKLLFLPHMQYLPFRIRRKISFRKVHLIKEIAKCHFRTWLSSTVNKATSSAITDAIGQLWLHAILITSKNWSRCSIEQSALQ